MRLLLVRHGPAGERAAFSETAQADAERPLTKEGRESVKKIAAGLKTILTDFDLIATSPLKRARQTAKILAEAYKGARLVDWAELAPGAAKTALWKRILDFGDDSVVAVVAHEPALSAFAGWLLSRGRAPALQLKKGGACLLELPKERKPGGAKLLWLLQPSHLRRLRD